jgi:S-(hydroxymethyl)glutathione synthase
VRPGDKAYRGGTLECHCTIDPVTVDTTSNVFFNHACGCTKCWKQASSLVAVIPRDKVSVSANPQTLEFVDGNAAIQRHACIGGGLHMFGRIEEKEHPFFGLDCVHPELLATILGPEPPTCVVADRHSGCGFRCD